MNEICNSKLCTGCSACANICPNNSIEMKQNHEGFIYPFVDTEKCIHCDKCKTVCPINKKTLDTSEKPITFAAKCKDENLRNISSSGGVFSLIAEYVLSVGGVVFGAGFDDSFNVVHKAALVSADLADIRGSKYVQSNIGNTYKMAKEYLERGITVLFTGTPCQIGGLYAYLRKEYTNLYTQDIICHGVPSPMVWKKYIEYRQEKNGSKVTEVSFRNKTNGWKHYSLKICFDNNSDYCSRNIEDPFLRSFIMNMDLRESCEKCSFKKIHREADITLSDFWNIGSVVPDWNDDKGVSAIMIHSEKGQKLFKAITENVSTIEVDFEVCLKANPSMVSSVPYNPLRRRFFRDVNRMPFDDLHQYYCGNGILSSLRRKMALVTRKLKGL